MFFKSKPFVLQAKRPHGICLSQRKRFFLFGPPFYVVFFLYDATYTGADRRRVYFDNKDEAMWFYRKLTSNTKEYTEVSNMDIDKEMQEHFLEKLV